MANAGNKQMSILAFQTKLKEYFEKNKKSITDKEIEKLAQDVNNLKNGNPYFFNEFLIEANKTEIDELYQNGSFVSSKLSEISKLVHNKIDDLYKTDQNSEKGVNSEVKPQNDVISEEDIKSKLDKMDFSNLSNDDMIFIGENLKQALSSMSYEQGDKVSDMFFNNAQSEEVKQDNKTLFKYFQVLCKEGTLSEDGDIFIRRFKEERGLEKEGEESIDFLRERFAHALEIETNIRKRITYMIEFYKENPKEKSKLDFSELLKDFETPEYEEMLKIFGEKGEAKGFLYARIEAICKELDFEVPDYVVEYFEKNSEEHDRSTEKMKQITEAAKALEDAKLEQDVKTNKSGNEEQTEGDMGKLEDLSFLEYDPTQEENNNTGPTGSTKDHESDTDLLDRFGWNDYSQQENNEVEAIEPTNDGQIGEGEEIQEKIEDISDLIEEIEQIGPNEIEEIFAIMMKEVEDPAINVNSFQNTTNQVLKSNIEAVGDISQDDTIISEPNTEDTNDSSQNENDNSFLARVKETISSIFTAIMNKERFGVGDGSVIPKDKGIRNSLINVGEDVMKYIKAVVEKIKNSFKNIDKIAKLNRGEQVALPPANNSVKTTKTNDFLESLIVPGNTVKLPDKQVSVNSVNVKPYIEKPTKGDDDTIR